MKISTLNVPLKAWVRAFLLAGFLPCSPARADVCLFTLVPASTSSVGEAPQSVATGDFNGDGRRDLVVANQFSANISVLLGNGNGTFQAAANYFVGQGPVAVAVGNFNTGSQPDLAVANSSTAEISILLGNSNGTFQTTNNFPVGTLPSWVSVRDLNADTILDLAVANRASGDVSVLFGNGNGTFQSAVSHVAGVDPVSVAAGDFNNDARSDLAVANAALFATPPSISILMGKSPNGTFQNAVDYDAGISPRSVVVGDFNADGKPDLAVADYGQVAGSSTTNSYVQVLLGVGNGTFLNAVRYVAGSGPIAIAIGDFDTNAIPDLVVANDRSTNISVLVGNGNGTFQAARHFHAGMHPRSVAVADFNGDNKPDVAVVNDAGVMVLVNSCLILADLAVTQTDTPDPIGAGLNVTYTITVTNGGPVSPPDVNLINALPSGLSFVSATPSQGNCTNNSGTVNCALGLLNSGAQATVTIVATTTTAGSVTNTATVSSFATTDPNSTNNTSKTTTTVLPRVSVAATDASASETGPNAGVFTVSRVGGTAGAVAVNYSMSGSAANGPDYAALSGSVTIPNGSASATVTINPVDELAVELTETAILTLAANAAYAINPASNSATVNILDNDVYAISINDVAQLETDAGTTTAIFTVSLSWSNPSPVTVNFATANGTAIAGSDYATTNGPVTFPPGVTNRTVPVVIFGDLLNETNETFFVNLSNPANGVIVDNQGLGTINNNDPLPDLSVTDVTVKEGTSGTTNAVFTVNLSPASGQTVTVNFATATGGATAGGDFASTNGTLTFAPGTTAQSFAVRINGDTITESNETYVVNLSAPGNANLSDGQAVGTIVNAEPAVSVGDRSVVEGDAGTTNAVFTLSLSYANLEAVTVNYATADGTATAGADYEATNGIVSFAPGFTNQTIAVTILPDVLNEANDTFFVNLSNPTNAIMGDGQGVGSINNDDPLPTVTISDVTLTEGDGGTINAVFTVGLSAMSGRSLSVNFATANGTATAGDDFVGSNGTLTFAAGVTNQTLTVTVLGDLLNEADDTFFVNLSSPTNAMIADPQGAGLINNDDPLPSLTINDLTVTEVNSGTSNAVFTVSLSAPSGRTLSVEFATTNGTAVAGADYVATNGVVTFAAGVTAQSITVVSQGDLLNEANETFAVILTNPFNALITDDQGIGTIANDDPLPELTITDVALSEGNSGTSSAVFTVSLSVESGQTVTVNYASVPGTAAAGSDYSSINNSLTFPPGTMLLTITIPVNGDLLNEADENFFVNLSSAGNSTIGDGQGVGNILNDDPLPSLTIGDVTVAEGNSGSLNAVFTVSLSAVSGRSLSVNFITANGTATAGSDYLANNGTVTVAAGSASQTFTVTVIGDLLNELDETFFVDLSNPINVLIADPQARGTIANNDPLPGIVINNVTLAESNSGVTNAVFTVSLTAASGRDVSVNFATTNGTASNGSDYVSAGGLVTFAAGATSQNINVPVLGDLSYELNETVLVNLTSPVNSILSDGQGVGTINNDDAPPSITISNAAVFEGNSGTANLVFPLKLSVASSLPVTVNYSTANDVAKQPSDYVRINGGQVTFNPGQSNQTVSVVINGDNSIEANETFFLNFSSPVNATLANSQAIGTILNDEGIPSLSISDVTVTEGNSGTANALLTVRLSAGYTEVVTVNYATLNGAALAGTDYLVTNGLLSFAAGTTTQTLAVKIVGDQISETNEALTVNLSGSINALISDGMGVATILDNDPFNFLLSTNVITVAEGGTNFFNVRLLSAPASNVSVTTTRTDGATNLDVSSGSTLTFTPANWNVFQPVFASAGQDANTSAETATFTVANGASQQLVSVTGLDDDVEAFRIVSVQLTGGNVIIRFTTSVGSTYRVEKTASLGSSLWSTVGSNVTGTGANLEVTDFAGAGQPARFYRAVLLPP